MWSRSMLHAAQAVALATVLLVSACACDSASTAKNTTAHTAAPTTTTTQRSTSSTVPLQLGCSSNGRPAPSFIGSGRYVALTFDDGPSPDYTAAILTTLERTRTPATFFVVGENVQRYPALVRREASDGFTLGVHTWDHPDMTKLSPQQREWELAATAQAIHNALGADYCLSFWRPPFGDYDDAVVAQADSLGLSTVTWDVDSQDYLTPGVRLIVDRVLSTVHPGAIILLHDGDHSRWQTAQALPLIITGLKQRGYIPVTLPVLLAAN